MGRRWLLVLAGVGILGLRAEAADKVVHVLGTVEKVVADSRSVLKVGDVLGAGDRIEGAMNSQLQIDSGTQKVFLLGPSQLEWKGPATRERGAPSEVVLREGKLRMKLAPLTSGPRKKAIAVVRTPGVSMGVRGTDFFASYGVLLGESEIVSFESDVEFAALESKGGKALVKAGQWGGLGGRFGARVGKPMSLPANVLNHFKGAFPIQ